MCTHFCLTGFTQYNDFEIQPHVELTPHAFLLPYSILDMSVLQWDYLLDRLLGCFSLLSSCDKAAMSTHVQFFPWCSAFMSHFRSRTGIGISSGRCARNFITIVPVAAPSWTAGRGSLFHSSYSAVMGFVSVSPVTKGFEHNFTCSWMIRISCVERHIFKSFVHLKLNFES